MSDPSTKEGSQQQQKQPAESDNTDQDTPTIKKYKTTSSDKEAERQTLLGPLTEDHSDERGETDLQIPGPSDQSGPTDTSLAVYKPGPSGQGGETDTSLVPYIAETISSDSDSDDDLWNLVRKYKELKELKIKMIDEGADAGSYVSSEISNDSLIVRQMDALAEFDEHAKAISSTNEDTKPEQGQLSILGTLNQLEVPAYNRESLLDNVQTVSENIKQLWGHPQ